MAWQMDFTDSWGEHYPESYWSIAQCNSCPRYSETGMIQFYGYPNATNKGKRVVGQHSYSIDQSDYETLVKQPIPNPVPQGISTAEDLLMYGIYLWAKNKLDVDTGTKDESGKPILKSFFDSAVMV